MGPESTPRRARPVNRASGSMGRREFLTRMSLLAVGGPALLAACTKESARSGLPGGSSASPTVTIASPGSPVTWPILKSNRPIADGLAPEKGATLQIFNYADYLGPDIIKRFEKDQDCRVVVSTFNDGDEALTKLRAGSSRFDLYFASHGDINKLVSGGLIRPLAHSYIPNISNVWPQFANPYYDGEWRYTVPYSVFTTGIGWRTDMVSEDVSARPDPYDVFWDTAYARKLAILDDRRSAMCMVALRAGITDLNTTRSSELALIRTQLLDLQEKTKPKVTITQYNDLPGGQYGLAQLWSGDIVNAQYYLEDGVTASVLRYWFPDDGKGMVDNDIMVVPRQGRNPVLAHLFVNFMLDTKTAVDNFGYIGYQPPQQSLDADRLVAEGYLPKNLADAVVRPEWFDSAYPVLELAPDGEAAWQRIWQEFKAGA